MCLLVMRKGVSLVSMLVLPSRGSLGLGVRDVSSASSWAAGPLLNICWLHELRDPIGESTIYTLASGQVGLWGNEAEALILGVHPPRGAWKMTVMMRCCQPLRGSAPPGEACGPPSLLFPPPSQGRAGPLMVDIEHWLRPVAPSLTLRLPLRVWLSLALWVHCAAIPLGPAAPSLMTSTPLVPSSWRRALSVR